MKARTHFVAYEISRNQALELFFRRTVLARHREPLQKAGRVAPR
jgi:hypothetical protein